MLEKAIHPFANHEQAVTLSGAADFEIVGALVLVYKKWRGCVLSLTSSLLGWL
jgi:hypothetical protein